MSDDGFTPCHVQDGDDMRYKALLIGVYQKAYTHGGGLVVGSFPPGQEAFPVAAVLTDSGEIKVVPAHWVTVEGARGIFEQYAWIDGGCDDQR